MKAISLISSVLIFINVANAQICTPLNSPKLGADTTVVISCNSELTNLTSLYNTSGLGAQWDIPDPTSAGLGYHKLIATNVNGCKDTAYITVSRDVKKWLGTESSDWHDSKNWTGNSLPNEKTHIIISGGTANPCIISAADVSIASITVINGGSYEIQNNRKLNINSSCNTIPAYYELSPNAKIIDNPTSQTIQLVDSAIIVFNGSTDQLKNLQIDDIIISGIAPNAPYGFLRRVDNIEQNGNNYTISTSEVSLEEAFKELYAQASQTYYDNGGTTLRKNPSHPLGLNLEGSFTYHDTLKVADGVELITNLEDIPSFSPVIYITNNRLDYAKFFFNVKQTAKIKIKAEKTHTGEYEKTVFGKVLPPMIIEPIIIWPVFTIKAGMNDTVEAAIGPEIENVVNTTAYIEYKNGNWLSNYDNTFEEKHDWLGAEGKVNVKAYVKPSIEFKFFGSSWAKGEIGAEGYLKGEAHLLPLPPDCKFSWGMGAEASLNLQVFNINLFSSKFDIFDYEKVIYRCRQAKVTTLPVTDIQSYSAMSGGIIVDSGSSPIISKGVCWSKFPNPSFNSNKTEDGAGVDEYNSLLNKLSQNTTYYIRAYAINADGDTAYGNEEVFMTVKDPTNLIRGYTYSLVSWRYGASVPGNINVSVPDDPNPNIVYEPGQEFYFDEAATFTVTSFNIPPSPPSIARGFGYSIGGFFQDSLFISNGSGTNSSNSYGHQYPEGWGLKLPPGYELIISFDSLPARISADGMYIYRGSGGDMIYRRN